MSTLIINTTLAPKEGYIEVEIDGIRQYQKIETEQDKQIAALMQQVTEAKASNTFLEGCLMEIAGIVYA